MSSTKLPQVFLAPHKAFLSPVNKFLWAQPSTPPSPGMRRAPVQATSGSPGLV